MNTFLNGIIFASAFAATVFFFNSWKKTRDQLFLCFSLAFALFGIERIVLSFWSIGLKYDVYLIRLVAFLLILIAIGLKNRK
jgi:NADH:ubiquinone oxidoreductase subunit 3 (subunit A)